MTSQTYFLCGIGGSGMTPLAYLLKEKGHRVYGSDRSYDQGKLKDKFQLFIDSGIKLFPQDGSGITSEVDYLVVSSAVEDRIPDVKAAKDKNVPIKKRAEVLAEQFNQEQGVAIAGTSGKTTVTAMTGYVFHELGLAPTIVNGGAMLNFIQGDVPQAYAVGGGKVFIAETDESDGSILLFHPEIGVLNNVADDHKPMDELLDIFSQYMKNCKKALVINIDNGFCQKLLEKENDKPVIRISLEEASADLYAKNIKYFADGSECDVVVDGNKVYKLRLNVPGQHNIYNALSCLGTVIAYGGDLQKAVEVLARYKGARRRLEIIGRTNDITVYDDFAHNPDKITASLSTLQEFDGRLLVMYQPHGFGPTKMLKDQLIESFVTGLKPEDIFIMPEIYYAGGTVERNISSNDIIDGVKAGKRQAHFFDTRDECGQFLKQTAQPGDRIVIMGARDDTLTIFAKDILKSVS